MVISPNSRTSAGTGVPADQSSLTNHNYFYTYRNEVIQESKLLLRKCSFWEKYKKNANLYTSIPVLTKQRGGFLGLTFPVFVSLSNP